MNNINEIEKNGQELICNEYKTLVISIARRYQGQGLDLDDLTQEGYIGLMEASKRYLSDKGCKFSTYATWWIRQAITRAIENTGSLIRIPSYQTIDAHIDTTGHIYDDIHGDTDTDIMDKVQLAEMVDKLDPEDKTIISMRYGLCGTTYGTLAQIGQV